MTRANLTKVVPYATILAAAVALYAVARQFNFTPRPGHLGPAVWPKAILVLSIAACVFEIVGTLVFGKGQEEVDGLLEVIEEEAAKNVTETIHEEPQATYPKLLITGIGLTVGYVLLFNVLGFFVDTLLYIVLFTLVGRYRKPGVALVSGLVGSLAFMFIFMKIVYLSLPVGQAPFSSVSLALMQLMGIR